MKMQSDMTRVTKTAERSDGFTMAELVAASAILFIVLVGIMGAVEYAGAASQMSSMRQAAIDIAQQEVEYDRNLPYVQTGGTGAAYPGLGVYYTNGMIANPAGSIAAQKTVTTTQGTFNVGTVVGWTWDPNVNPQKAAYKKVTVTVSWTSPQPGSFSIETAVYGVGGATTLGDIKFTCVDVEHQALPAAGVRLDLKPASGSTQSVWSDSTGLAIFGQFPLGTPTSLVGTSTAWLVDTSGVTVTNVVAGPQDWGKVYCQKPAGATIHVHSPTVPNLANIKVVLKDTTKNITYTTYTDSSGNAVFYGAGGCNGNPGLWKDAFSATAMSASGNSTPGTFSITAGGQMFTGLDLLVPDQPSIKVSMVASATGLPAMTGETWTLTVKDHLGAVVYGPLTNTADFITLQIPAADTYSVTITGVNGFGDNTVSFTANATTANQACVVKMPPLFVVAVRGSGTQISVPATITMTGPSTLASATSIGKANFVIPATGYYNLTALVNGITYTGPTNVYGDPLNPTLAPYYIDFTMGKLSVAVNPGTGSWSRMVAVYDASNSLVTTGTATVAAPTPVFNVAGGRYTVVVCGTLATLPLPAALPANTTNKYKQYPLVSPYVLTDGSTYFLTGAAAPN